METEFKLARIFDDYKRRSEPLTGLTKIEEEIEVPIPSRTGRRASPVYRFQCFLDGFTVDPQTGYEWLVEYKLRGRLTTHEMLTLGRQYLWYAWARQRQTGLPVVGLLVDERLNAYPGPPRVKKAKKGEGVDGWTVSHAVSQTCTAQQYVDSCRFFGVDPAPGTVEALRDRVWQQRYPIMFAPSELEEAGRELVSAGQLIRDLDAGRYPIRNARPQICNWCDFKRVCKTPGDELFVDLMYERTVPKRLRPPKDEEQEMAIATEEAVF
jgi:hypothetical protein